MTKSTEQQLGEIARRKSKREALYHILLREVVTHDIWYNETYSVGDFDEEEQTVCIFCGTVAEGLVVDTVHRANCLITRISRALAADADEIARLLDVWAQGRGGLFEEE